MPSEGDILLLAKLGRAVGVNSNHTTLTRLDLHGRGSIGTETKLSQFDASTLSSMTINPDQATAQQGSFIGTMNFSSYGDLFLTRIADVADNFTWSETSDNFNQVYIDDGSPDITATWGINEDPHTGETINIRGKFHEDGQSDGFNDHVTNYNTNLTDVFTYNNPD